MTNTFSKPKLLVKRPKVCRSKQPPPPPTIIFDVSPHTQSAFGLAQILTLAWDSQLPIAEPVTVTAAPQISTAIQITATNNVDAFSGEWSFSYLGPAASEDVVFLATWSNGTIRSVTAHISWT